MLISTFINWDASTTNAMLGYTSAVLSDMTPLLTIIIGVGLGLIILGAIISAIRGHN